MEEKGNQLYEMNRKSNDIGMYVVQFAVFSVFTLGKRGDTGTVLCLRLWGSTQRHRYHGPQGLPFLSVFSVLSQQNQPATRI